MSFFALITKFTLLLLIEIKQFLLNSIGASVNMSNGIIQCGSYTLDYGKKTLIMGVLNVTPDSFSDGGRYNQIDKAVERARKLVE